MSSAVASSQDLAAGRLRSRPTRVSVSPRLRWHERHAVGAPARIRAHGRSAQTPVGTRDITESRPPRAPGTEGYTRCPFARNVSIPAAYRGSHLPPVWPPR